VVYSASCYLSGLLADHFPKQRVLAIGYSVAVIPAIALMLPGVSFAKFAVVFGFSGLYMGVWETLEQTTAATILPRSQRGKGFGVLATLDVFADLGNDIGHYHIGGRSGSNCDHQASWRSGRRRIVRLIIPSGLDFETPHKYLADGNGVCRPLRKTVRAVLGLITPVEVARPAGAIYGEDHRSRCRRERLLVFRLGKLEV
jgi:MFS family permease